MAKHIIYDYILWLHTLRVACLLPFCFSTLLRFCCHTQPPHSLLHFLVIASYYFVIKLHAIAFGFRVCVVDFYDLSRVQSKCRPSIYPILPSAIPLKVDLISEICFFSTIYLLRNAFKSLTACSIFCILIYITWKSFNLELKCD